MDEQEQNDDAPVAIDIGERLRSWRVFLVHVRWFVTTAALVLALLLVFRTHG